MPQPLGCCALLFNSHHQVLLGKRKNGYKAGLYGLPGGRIEVGEPVNQAIEREVEEETGISLSELKYVGVIKEKQNTYDFVHFVFAHSNLRETPKNSEPNKCEGWEWFDLEALPENILPGHFTAIQLFQKKVPLIDLN